MAKKHELKVPKSKRSKDAKRILALRKRMGWSQLQLAEEFGVTAGAVNHWEMGTRAIPGPVLKLIGLFESGKLKAER
jgi:DNA-binding transcriptional regulator YiaG